MRDRVFRIGRIHLRIERGDFYRDDSPPETARRSCLTDRSSPGSARDRPSSSSMQRAAYSSASFSLTTASPSKSTVKPIRSLRRFAQRLHHVLRIAAGDELPRHAGDVPAQNRRGEPGENARRLRCRSAGTGRSRCRMPAKYSPRCCTISPERRSDASTSTKRNICTLKCLVAHRERHHPLVESGLAEDRFGVLIDQLENLQPALLDLLLQTNSCADSNAGYRVRQRAVLLSGCQNGG